MKFATLLLGVMALSACKTSGPSGPTGLSGEVTPQKSVLLVGFGGWNSCRLQTNLAQLPTAQGFVNQGPAALNQLLTPKDSFTYGQLLNLAKTMAAAGVDVKWMSTCFFIGLPIERSIWFMNSDGKAGHMPTLDISAEIKTFAGEREVILIGHSYGGWMSATVSSQIDRPVLGTFTLEAISGESCPTSAALTGTASQYEYCQKAPDANAVDLSKAQSNVKQWTNIYLEPEGRDLDIYSGPYPAPVDNVTLAYTNIDKGPFANAHHLLGLGKKTWDLICARTAALLQVSGACNGLNVDQWGRAI